MKKISKIKIEGHGIIADTILPGIDKITIVCGKNNSGKSLLLKELVTGTRNFHCLEYNEEIDLIIRSEIEKEKFRVAGNELKRLLDAAMNLIRNQFQAGLWTNEVDRFNKTIYQTLRNSGYYEQSPDALANRLNAQIFHRNIRKLYILTKRDLINSMAFSFVNQISNDGGGLLAKLLSLSTQNESSAENTEYQKIKTSFREITDGTDFNVRMNNLNQQIEIQFKNKNGDFVHADECGLGLREVVFFLYILHSRLYDFICIDELEIHLHPELTKKLINKFSAEFDGLLFLATHSNVVISTQAKSGVILAESKNGKVLLHNDLEKVKMMEALGYSVSDNLISDLIVLVEGHGDVLAYRELVSKFDDLKNMNINFWPMGGDQMHYLDFDLLNKTMRLCAIVDGDYASGEIREAVVEKCDKLGIPCHRLKCYSIENLFSKAAIRKIYPQEMKSISDDGYFDPTKKLFKTKRDGQISEDSQLHFSIKRRIDDIMKVTTLEEILGCELNSVILKIREAIKRVL